MFSQNATQANSKTACAGRQRREGAPLSGTSVILSVDENDLAKLHPCQESLNAIPTTTFTLKEWPVLFAAVQRLSTSKGVDRQFARRSGHLMPESRASARVQLSPNAIQPPCVVHKGEHKGSAVRCSCLPAKAAAPAQCRVISRLLPA